MLKTFDRKTTQFRYFGQKNAYFTPFLTLYTWIYVEKHPRKSIVGKNTHIFMTTEKCSDVENVDTLSK